MAIKGKKKEQTERAATAADYGVLLKPIITEKSSIVGGIANCVVFEVDSCAKKPEIRQAVERIYRVQVTSVRTVRGLGKLKRRGNQVGRTRSIKKAYVALAEGQAIDLVEGL